MSKEDSRKIVFEAIDPTGQSYDSVEVSYYNLGYDKPPEEYPSTKIMHNDIELELQEEPMKKVRYLLKIGDFEYFVSRNGKIMEQVEPEIKPVDNECDCSDIEWCNGPHNLCRQCGKVTR